ncbi:MAG: ATP-dependent DNA helicase [Comamonadaceae bacterium]|nr:MAG: ATP-dependent DNA helicase [Comamonadaceae bacterium]
MSVSAPDSYAPPDEALSATADAHRPDIVSSEAVRGAGPSVSVKSLCAFAAKAGDLDLRFVPSPTAHQGIAGHARVQSRRASDYRSELSLTAMHGGLRVRGRADGYDPTRRRLEEIKTFRGRFESIKDNHRALHWAQARVYGWMLCCSEELAELTVSLVYLDLNTDEETVIEERWTRERLKVHFEALCEVYQRWADDEAAHAGRKRVALGELRFPHPVFRAGQRDVAEAVFRVARGRRALLVQAPTGIGKTVATLFPLLKAGASERIDKVFFLTAKTPGRSVALQALERLVPATLGLRVVELSSREKTCEHPGQACHGEACPLARGFYDRLPQARAEAAGRGRLALGDLRDVALRHAVCPYYLGHEMVRWADVVVGDYNHFFDSSAFLFALTREEEWEVAVLVDEAHNLLSRARGMYTAELDSLEVAAARAVAPLALRPALARIEREWARLQTDQTTAHAILDEMPEAFVRTVQEAVSACADHFAERPEDSTGALQRCFFDLIQFGRLAESFGSHSLVESTVVPSAGRGLAIRNLIPAPFLAPRFAAARSTVCFSGTLSPFEFHRDTLGLPQNTATLDVASPFMTEQLTVRVATDLSTRWRDRSATLDRLTDIIGSQYSARPGNYLAFFSSFDYLGQAAKRFTARHAEVPVWLQSREMGEGERGAFIARFRDSGRGIGFAVLGGAFGEGIDLPGDRLIGAFVASLGLPQHDEHNEAMRERMEEAFGQGYAYTYLYPGIQKVVQAAGRVIRTEHDSGVLVLLDQRFMERDITALLPGWWDMRPLDPQA